MWKLYERPRREYRKNLYPAVNINRGGFFLNRMACDLIGMSVAGDVRYLLFYTDDKNKNLFGFRVLLNAQENLKDIYKVKYRDANKTAKINAKQFVIKNDLLSRALKLEQTTFPIIKDKEDIFFFELK